MVTHCSVSYTHLDVYKRQQSGCHIQHRTYFKSALHKLHIIVKKYNSILFVEKYKVMGFCVAFQKRTRIMTGNRTIEQVSSFNFLCFNTPYLEEVDLWNKIERLMNGTIKRSLKNIIRQETFLKFYSVMSMPSCLYGSETWKMEECT